MTKQQPDVRLTPRFTNALDYARVQHAEQVRKGSGIPYLYHLLGVASLVLEHGGDEDQAIAGLLHDVIEDCGSRHEAVLRELFGDRVTGIVLACTDGSKDSKEAAITPKAKYDDWLRRKRAYIAHLHLESDEALLVSCCDKLHNARAIVGDLEDPAVGITVFDRFTAKRDGTLRYYQSVSEIFTQRGTRAARALDATVARMHALANVSAREALV